MHALKLFFPQEIQKFMKLGLKGEFGEIGFASDCLLLENEIDLSVWDIISKYASAFGGAFESEDSSFFK